MWCMLLGDYTYCIDHCGEQNDVASSVAINNMLATYFTNFAKDLSLFFLANRGFKDFHEFVFTKHLVASIKVGNLKTLSLLSFTSMVYLTVASYKGKFWLDKINYY